MDPRSLILAVILGSGAVVFSMLGQGGGVLYTPMQVLLGVDFHTAVLQSLWFMILTALPPVLMFRKKRQVDWALAFVMESTSFAGAFVSGYFAKQFHPQLLSFALAALVVGAGVSMLVRVKPRGMPRKRSRLDWMRERDGEVYRINLAQGLPLSFLIGIAAGVTGTAAGFLKVPMLVRLFGVPVKVAFASSALMVTLTASGGLLGHLAAGSVGWHDPLLLSAFVLVGSEIGPRLSMRAEPASLRKNFAFYLFALACLVLASTFFASSGGNRVLPLIS